MKYLHMFKNRVLALGCSALVSTLVLGCDQSSEAPDVAEVDGVEVGAKDDGPAAEPIAQVLRADCETTMERCSAITCTAGDSECGQALEVCDTKLAGLCELVESDAEADLGPCGDGTRCEFMEAVHACFKASLGGCDGKSQRPDDCLLKSVGKLPACIAQAMKDHGGCDGQGCPGGEIEGPGDGCLDPSQLGDSCPAGGCLLQWVKSMGQGGCLLNWLGKAGKGCPDCG